MPLAVFVSISGTETTPAPITETGVVGVKVQVVPAGRPEQDRVTVPLYAAVTPCRLIIVDGEEPPAGTVTVVGVPPWGHAPTQIMKSGLRTADAKAVTKLATFAEPRPAARLKLLEALYPSEPAKGPV
jgi:hypothetical protein